MNAEYSGVFKYLDYIPWHILGKKGDLYFYFSRKRIFSKQVNSKKTEWHLDIVMRRMNTICAS